MVFLCVRMEEEELKEMAPFNVDELKKQLEEEGKRSESLDKILHKLGQVHEEFRFQSAKHVAQGPRLDSYVPAKDNKASTVKPIHLDQNVPEEVSCFSLSDGEASSIAEQDETTMTTGTISFSSADPHETAYST